MRYALVGYGRMGRAIDVVASARGHRRTAVVDTGGGRGVARSIDAASWRGVEVVFEFTEPSAARANVIGLLERGLAVVCGTTGWDAEDRGVRRALSSGGGALLASPNFSVGVALFLRLAESAAAAYAAAGGYDPWIVEAHHRGKRDAPSGTARRLARLVAEAGAVPAPVREGTPAEPLSAGAVHLQSIRAGHEPGRHTVGFDGPFDRIELTHAARGREGFASGAVLAAEWLRGRRGRHDFERVVAALGGPTRKPERGGGRR